MEPNGPRVKKWNYKDADIKEALEKINSKELNPFKASKIYGVPKSTLHDRLKGIHNGIKGAKTVLTTQEEQAIVSWIEDYALMGHALTKDRILNAAKKLSDTHKAGESKFGPEGPSEKWLCNFLKRNPSVSLRVPENVTRAAANVTPLNITIWFEKFTTYLEQKNLLQHLSERPQNWLNLDESGVDINALPKKVFTTKRIKHTYKVEPSKHNTRITITMCIAADGTILTPQIIYSKKFSRVADSAFAAGEEKTNFLFSQSENGWQNKSTYWAYLKKIHEEVKNKMMVEGQYIICSDGYPAHMDLELYKWCRDQGIIYVILYPNATHILQPCDLVVFKPLKSQYEKETAKFKVERNKIEIDEVDFVTIIARAIRKGVSAETIKNGFRAAGLFPLNRENVHDERLLGNLPPRQVQSISPQNLPTSMSSIPTLANFQAPMNQKEMLSSLKIITQKYQASIQSDDMMSSFHCDIINQQLNCLQALQSSRDSSLMISPQIASIAHTSVNQEILSEPMEASTPLNSIENILEPPPSNVRKRSRQMKIDKCGVMSTDEIINAMERSDQEKMEKENGVIERKRIRLEKRELDLKIKQEKVEKAVEKAAEKAAEKASEKSKKTKKNVKRNLRK